MILTRKIITKREGRGGRFVTDVYLSQTCPLDPLSLYRLPKVRFECALHNIQVSNSSIRRNSLKEDYHDLEN